MFANTAAQEISGFVGRWRECQANERFPVLLDGCDGLIKRERDLSLQKTRVKGVLVRFQILRCALLGSRFQYTAATPILASKQRLLHG